MGVAIFIALAALQDPADVPTVQLPPLPAEEQAKPAAPPPARLVVPPVEARRIADGATASDGPSLAGFVTASIGVVALLGGAVWLLRKYGKTSRFLGGGGPIRVLGRKSVGARQEILLIEVGPRVLVVGATRDRLSALGEIANPDEVAVLRADLPARREESAATAFKDTLREGLKGAPAPAEDAKGVYASIADELADIRKTVHAWKA
ncbi:MAG TPA: flagellar biosynthetic protein FliO [Planctomycetota bacterium]